MPRSDHLPLELLQTFVLLAELDGDASAVAERLQISQPSVSKRLTALRRFNNETNGQPWLLLKGKRWRLTSEGQRVRGVVTDLVKRYGQMEQFLVSSREGKRSVAIACGQQAASGFIRVAVERFLTAQTDCRVRVSTPRGKARIEGVAGGQFEFAVVTDSPAVIHRIAKREMFVEELFYDRFVLAGNPPPRSVWGAAWNALPNDRPVKAAELLDMPFILPEPDAGRRQQFEEWCFRATEKTVDVVLEAGGWQTILDYAESGVGVGLVTQSVVDAFRGHRHSKLTTRPLDVAEFPPDAVRLIARKVHGKEEPEVTDLGDKLRRLIHDQLAR